MKIKQLMWGNVHEYASTYFLLCRSTNTSCNFKIYILANTRETEPKYRLYLDSILNNWDGLGCLNLGNFQTPEEAQKYAQQWYEDLIRSGIDK